MRRSLLLLALLLMPFHYLAASPYESLGFALREQTILQDLRAHCHVSTTVSDQALTKYFTDNKETHDEIIAAADALKAGNQQLYHKKISDVSCPSGLASK
ncbi:MAG: hypothetical protein PW844_09920 [Pantoea sp.]|uniref:YicS family protein n=1 Tax=Pantoea sp. TaxID=69393 RepID=UPI00239E8796|nr:YicS family protein [Pantoea sp.]MDE1186784.1 hypothetical protein [Pantoea sp.]